MSATTIAVLEQIKALSEEERQELLNALPSLAPSNNVPPDALDRLYEALDWHYEGGVDDAARVDEFQR
jgi:hypothetical protein